MKLKFRSFILLVMLGLSSISFASQHYNILMIDESRQRTIPVEIYEGEKQENLPVVIINHGYGTKNTEYSFIANSLAAQGYFVISIQHDLENDAPLPRTGNLFERRKPFWERGVKNILFVVNKIKKEKPSLNLNQVILIGHSNGGDIAMMFATQYPRLVTKIISLDSLRYPFPIDKGIPILRFSASDTKPDDGVVPDKGVKTIFIKGSKHIDLCDRGTAYIKEEILKSIIIFLKKHAQKFECCKMAEVGLPQLHQLQIRVVWSCFPLRIEV